MPVWAQMLPKDDWYDALYAYIETIINRYRNHPALGSWQLENEALLKDFGHCLDNDYSHERLRREFKLIKDLDDKHPVIMTLSDSWGLPWRQPKPDLYAISLYRQNHNKGSYNYSRRGPWFYRGRATAIRLIKQRRTFIHELQAEPWPDCPITEAPLEKQLELMSPEKLKENIAFAMRTNLYPIDLWGLEWWYWLRLKHDYPSIWKVVQEMVNS